MGDYFHNIIRHQNNLNAQKIQKQIFKKNPHDNHFETHSYSPLSDSHIETFEKNNKKERKKKEFYTSLLSLFANTGL